MTSLILFTVFSFIPFIATIGIMGFVLQVTPEAEEDSSWEEWVPATPERLAFDSADLLIQELETLGVTIAGLGYNLAFDCTNVYIDHPELHTTDVDVSEFDCPVDIHLIMNISDAVVAAAELRDGYSERDTLVEFVEAPTAILVDGEEASDEDILSMLTDPFVLEMDMESFDHDTEIETPVHQISVDEWLEEQDMMFFVLAATEVH